MARRIGNETGDDEITTPVLRSSSTSIDSMDMSTTSPPSCNQTPSKTIPSSCSSFLPHSESNELRVAENTSCDVNLASRKANESGKAFTLSMCQFYHHSYGTLLSSVHPYGNCQEHIISSSLSYTHARSLLFAFLSSTLPVPALFAVHSF